MTQAEIEKRIREMDRPASSAALRERVIAHAPVVAAPVLWSDRVWFSRSFRWSVAAAAVVLLAIASRQGPEVDVSQTARAVVAEACLDD